MDIRTMNPSELEGLYWSVWIQNEEHWMLTGEEDPFLQLWMKNIDREIMERL